MFADWSDESGNVVVVDEAAGVDAGTGFVSVRMIDWQTFIPAEQQRMVSRSRALAIRFAGQYGSVESVGKVSDVTQRFYGRTITYRFVLGS